MFFLPMRTVHRVRTATPVLRSWVFTALLTGSSIFAQNWVTPGDVTKPADLPASGTPQGGPTTNLTPGEIANIRMMSMIACQYVADLNARTGSNYPLPCKTFKNRKNGEGLGKADLNPCPPIAALQGMEKPRHVYAFTYPDYIQYNAAGKKIGECWAPGGKKPNQQCFNPNYVIFNEDDLAPGEPCDPTNADCTDRARGIIIMIQESWRCEVQRGVREDQKDFWRIAAENNDMLCKVMEDMIENGLPPVPGRPAGDGLPAQPPLPACPPSGAGPDTDMEKELKAWKKSRKAMKDAACAMLKALGCEPKVCK